MKLIAREQINLVLAASILGLNLSVVSTSTNVSSSLATMLNTAGRNNVSVPVQVSTNSDTVGLITSGVNNRVILRNNLTKDPIRNGEEEVYARLTNSASVYTLTYFSNINGAETPYSFASATAIDFLVPYRFNLFTLPVDALISTFATLLNPDVVGSATASAQPFAESLTIATVNVIPVLTKTPFDNTLVRVTVNGVIYWTITPLPAFSISGKNLTWIPANAYTLAVGSDVVAVYTTTE